MSTSISSTVEPAQVGVPGLEMFLVRLAHGVDHRQRREHQAEQGQVPRGGGQVVHLPDQHDPAAHHTHLHGGPAGRDVRHVRQKRFRHW